MKTMLVVDDEPKICDCLKQFFQSKGFGVVSANTGSDAVEWLSKNQADVILVDIRLPDMSGIEVLKRARELKPEAKIVMVTAYDSADPRVDSASYGADAFITKPFDFSDLTWESILSDSP